ncbi:hypothetical protein GCM10027577_12420 [Spirosoma fluminis]
MNGGIDVFGAFVNTSTASGDGFFCAQNPKPDFNVTNINQPVTGNVSTNDVVAANTTYGPFTLVSSPNGSSPSLTPNGNGGSYTFNTATPGVYVYNVTVCAPNQSNCPTQTLTITALNPTVTTNNPVVNPDIASTVGPNPVTVNVKANDGPGNTGGTLGTPTVTGGPSNGNAVVNGQNIVYTPNANFVGTDQFTYQVCETPGGRCGTAAVTVTVLQAGLPAVATAADDYVNTAPGVTATGNVLTNDSPGLTVTGFGPATSPAGTLTLNPNGTFSFAPAAGVTGPVDFTYTACTNGGQPCATATLHVLVSPTTTPNTNRTNPDFNVTNINQTATGNVSTNDVVPAGTTYGSPTLASGPNGGNLSLQPNGTYTFTTATPGVYVYNVPVNCPGGGGCAAQTLTITAINPAVTTNNPVVNPDIATTTGTNPVAVNVKANDGPGNTGGTLGTPTVSGNPANGTTSINGQNVVYTPNAGFTGTDSFTYTVCETPGNNLCGSAVVTVTVLPNGSPAVATAADDYVSTAPGVNATGNVLTNDSPGLTVTNTGVQNVTGGSLQLNGDGTYIFTPTAGFTGPVNFTYTACGSGGQPCASASLHVLVKPTTPANTNTIYPDFNVTNINQQVSGNVSTNDIAPAGTTYGPTTQASGPGGATFTLQPNGTYTFITPNPGVYVYNVPVNCPGGSCPTQTLTITALNPTVTTNAPVVNPDVASTVGTTPVTINVKANDGPGNTGGTLGAPEISTGATNGNAAVNGQTIVYTPNPGFTGTDSFVYRVCETPANQCGFATVTVTVRPAGSPAVATAADDYVSTAPGSTTTGNVLTNDSPGLTVTNPGTYSPAGGTLTLNSNGTYSFVPNPGVTGPVDFTYTACGGTPQSCASATLHVLVKPTAGPDLTPSINLPQANFSPSGPNATRNFTVELQELRGLPTAGTVVFTLTAPFGYEISYNGGLTSIAVSGGGTVPVENTRWTASQNGQQFTLTLNNGQVIPANGTAVIGFTITRTFANSGTPANIIVNITNDNTNSAYDSNALNNNYTRIINASLN